MIPKIGLQCTGLQCTGLLLALWSVVLDYIFEEWRHVFGLHLSCLWSSSAMNYWITISAVVPGLPPLWCYEWNHDGIMLR